MPITAKLSVLDHVDGSTHLITPSVTVLCGVTWPIEPRARQELPTSQAVDIVVRPSKGVPSTREKLIEDKLRSIFTALIAVYMNPRKLCQITCQILKSDDTDNIFTQNELSACINAIFLALIDAGVPLKSSVSALVIALDQNGALISNPTYDQLKIASSIHTLAFELGDGTKVVKSILLLDSVGDFTKEQLFDVLEQGELEGIQTGSILRKIIEQRVKDAIIS